MVEICNGMGQIVRIALNKEFAPGYYTETIETRELPSGIYFLRFTIGTQSYSKKIVKLK